MAKDGKRVLALSQEFLNWAPAFRGPIKAYQKVRLEQIGGDDPRCNGEFLVVDAMNVRYRNRGDLFFLSRKDNISCKATLYFKK